MNLKSVPELQKELEEAERIAEELRLASRSAALAVEEVMDHPQQYSYEEYMTRAYAASSAQLAFEYASQHVQKLRNMLDLTRAGGDHNPTRSLYQAFRKGGFDSVYSEQSEAWNDFFWELSERFDLLEEFYGLERNNDWWLIVLNVIPLIVKKALEGD